VGFLVLKDISVVHLLGSEVNFDDDGVVLWEQISFIAPSCAWSCLVGSYVV